MSATKLFDAGFTPLVSVVPPNAELSPNSKIDPSQCGKVPGRKGKNGWYGYPFLTGETTRRDAAQMERVGANVGIQGRHFPGLDIDSRSAVLTDAVIELAYQTLGRAPERFSVEPRRLLMYRCDEPMGRMAMIVTKPGSKVAHLIEWLADGRQWLVYGTHPSGNLYRWETPPWELTPDDIPLVTRDEVIHFFDLLKGYLVDRGLVAERTGDGAVIENERAERVSPESLRAPSDRALAEMVLRIPNPVDNSWDDYIQMGYAIKAACHRDDLGLRIFQKWASSWEQERADGSMDETNWEGFHDSRVGWNWLVEQAEKAGTYASAPDDFADSVDMDAKPSTEPAPLPDEPLTIEQSDEWAVQKIRVKLLDLARYVPLNKGWVIWNGHKWERDELQTAQARIIEELRRLALWLKDRASSKTTKAAADPLKASARRLQSSAGISAIEKLLQSRLAVRPTVFDTEPMLLNTPGGVVDLHTGELMPPNPALMMSRATAVTPLRWTGGEWETQAPLWTRFLQDACGHDEKLIDYLQRLTGYCLTGMMHEKLMNFFSGRSETGKSQLIDVLTGIFGDYSATVDVGAFLRSKGGDRVPADIAQLPGVRLVTATEPEAGRKWDEQKLKAITGGDAMSARLYFGQWFTYKPQFKILVVGNHEPEISLVDDAMLRRIHIVPFDRKVPRERQIPNLGERIVQEEGAAVLAWMVEGALRWQREGLPVPDAIRLRTEEYAQEEDLVQQWLDEECDVGPEYESSRFELFQSWSQWCRAREENPGRFGQFRRMLLPSKQKYRWREKQHGTKRRSGYKGVAVRNVNVDEATEDFDAGERA